MNSLTAFRHEVKLTVEGSPRIEVGQRMGLMDSSTGDIAGIMVKDLMLPTPLPAMQTSEDDRRNQLTDAFIECAARALSERTAVIFFDATEKMTTETEKWVWCELLPAACEGRMGNAKFVLCGRAEPQVDRMLAAAIEIRQLKPLAREHVHAYLQLRGVEEEHCAEIATLLLALTKGNPYELATAVDTYLKLRANLAGAAA
jgi:hypothetical protein